MLATLTIILCRYLSMHHFILFSLAHISCTFSYCHDSRYALAYLSKTQTAQATARILWDNFICHYGFPEKFISDQGRNFESDLIKELCKIAGVKKLHTTPYHPQGNGQCERFNSTLCNMLGTLSEGEKSDWKSYLGCMTYAYNCTKHGKIEIF